MYYSTKFNVQTVIKVSNSIDGFIGRIEAKSEHPEVDISPVSILLNIFNNYAVSVTLQCIIQQNSIFKMS
jgi:hypothetical protein